MTTIDDTLVFTFKDGGFQLYMHMHASSAEVVCGCRKHHP
jgi:hypothetical protein